MSQAPHAALDQPETEAARGKEDGNGHLVSGMTEIGIRAAIASLEALLPERSRTVEEIWGRYFLTLPQDQRWVESVGHMMRRVLKEIGHVPAIQLLPSHWTGFKVGTGASLSATTRNLCLTRTKAMLYWAVDEKMLPANPIGRVKREKAKSKRRSEFTEDDELRIMEKAPLMLNVLFVVAMGSAMRHDAIRLLRWDRIDWENKTIEVAWNDPENKSRRNDTIRIKQRALDALRLMPHVPGSDYVFANPHTKEPYSYTRLWQLFRETADSLGIKCKPGDVRIHFHDTRRSVGSRLDRAGARLTSIQKILQHANLSTTAIYLETRAKEVDEDFARLREQRKGPKPKPVMPGEKRKGPKRAEAREQNVTPETVAE